MSVLFDQQQRNKKKKVLNNLNVVRSRKKRNQSEFSKKGNTCHTILFVHHIYKEQQLKKEDERNGV